MADNRSPTLQQLLRSLKTLENWFVFGVILGVPVPQLKKIESSYSQRELERCKIDMLQFWLENKLIPTWKEVVQALEQSDQLVLAAQVKHDYLWSSASIDNKQDESMPGLGTNSGLPPATPPFSNSPSPADRLSLLPAHTLALSSTTLSVASPATSDEVKTEIRADIAVVGSLRELEGALGLVLVRVKRLLVLNKCDLSEALLCLSPVIGSEELISCDNFTKLVWQLQRNHIDVFNISVLQQLVACFDNDEVNKVIEEYNERKETFLKHTTVLDFQRAVVSRVQPILSIGMASVTITISKEMASHQTLRDIEKLAMEGFEECHKKFIHLHAEPGSIIISWHFPEKLRSKLEQLAYDNAAVFKSNGVVEVAVGEKRVFPCTQHEDIVEKEEKSKLKLLYIEFYQQLVEAVSDSDTCHSLTTQLHSTSLLSEEKKALLSSSQTSGSSYLKVLGVEEEPHLVTVLMEKMLAVKELQTLSEDMSAWLSGSKQGVSDSESTEKQNYYERQQLLEENEKLTSDKTDLLKRMQCYEDDLRTANELLRMREKAITGMMSAQGRYTDVEEREKRINLLKKELEELRTKGIESLLSREVEELKSKLATMSDELDKATKSNAELSSQVVERNDDLKARLGEFKYSSSPFTLEPSPELEASKSESSALEENVPAPQVYEYSGSTTRQVVRKDDEEEPSIESKLEEDKRKFEAEMQRMYELKLNEISLENKREGEKYAREMQLLMDELKQSESKLEMMRRELFQKRESERQEASEITKSEKKITPDSEPPLQDDQLLPIPLFILGDNHALRQELFKILASSESSETDTKLRQSSLLLKGFTGSDKYMQRQELSMKHYYDLDDESDSELLPYIQQTPSSQGDETVLRHQFILHVPTQDLDQQLAHIYFKSSGLYLIVISLDDLVENPLGQYSKLFYWVNLIHTYISPEAIKRMIVVGMYSKSDTNEDYLLISVDLVNKVLQQYKQVIRLPKEDRGFVFMFDREDRALNSQNLFASIAHCLKIFQQSVYYSDNRLYLSIFEPFQSFHQIASKIALNHDGKVIEGKEQICQWYHELFQSLVPLNYYETLMAYSPVCISKGSEYCLLTPSFIPDLLTRLSLLDKQVFDDPASLCNLPVISASMLKWCFNQLKPDSKNFEFLLWWMEKLNIIYDVGRVGKDEKFFVPYLVQHDTSDHSPYQLDQKHISTMFQDSVTIYAQFSDNLPTTVHLFHRAIAQMLRSVIKNGSQQQICFIAQHDPEAVLPLYDDDHEFLCEVWLKYRALQNIMEFQAVKVLNKMKFLKVIEKELSQAYLGSSYYNKGIYFNQVVTFHIPGGTISETSINPCLYQLAQIGTSMDEITEHLVATAKLTESGNRQITPALRQWAIDSDPNNKKLPPELYMNLSRRLSINDRWTQLGTKLGLYTFDELELMRSQSLVDGGHDVLHRWRNSRLSIRHLTDALRRLDLDCFAREIEAFAANQELTRSITGAFSYSHSNYHKEKKLPIELFDDFACKLNSGLKWAEFALSLKLLNSNSVEELKLKHYVDKGSHVLQLWTDSYLTYQDLINGLQYVHCNREAEQVEIIVKSLQLGTLV